jgi:hypothetical protein
VNSAEGKGVTQYRWVLSELGATPLNASSTGFAGESGLSRVRENAICERPRGRKQNDKMTSSPDNLRGCTELSANLLTSGAT